MNNKLCTVGAFMSGKSWWKWALFGLLALYSLLLVSRCSPIEQDLHARTSEALNEKGLAWASPTLEKRGRDVMLTGEAPSEEARELAINTAANVYGVRVVDHDITLKQYSTPVFGLNSKDGKTTLSGSFPEQGLIDQTLRTASDNFGADNVVNEMTVSKDVSSPSWLPAALGVLPAMVAMKGADLLINNDNATIEGSFETDDEKQSFLKLATDAFGDKLTDNSVVEPSGPTPEELAEIARKAEAAEAAKIAEEKRLAEEAEKARLAEEERLAEAAKVSEQKRLAEEAEAARLAEEKRLAAEAAAKLEANKKSMAAIMLAATAARESKAEEKRLAEEAEAARLAEEKRLAEEAARIAEEKRLAEEAEAARIANEKKMAAIMLAAQKAREAKAEAARLAEEKRLAEEAARIAEEKRLAEEAEAARIANEKKMAAIMLAAQKAREAKAEAARLAEEKRLAEEAEAARLAEQKRLEDIAREERAAERRRQAAIREAELAKQKREEEIARQKRLEEQEKAAALAEERRRAREKAEAERIAAENVNRHTHPSNQYTNAVTHKHPSSDPNHTHNYSGTVQKRAPVQKVSHSHPQNQFSKAVTHAHANGGSNHTHNYGVSNQQQQVITSLESQVAALATQATSNADCQQSINATMRGQRILFATASATIDRQSYALLNSLAERIRRCEKRIQVSGHTDSRGAADMNMKLSQDRARAVRNYLRNRGVGRSVISSRGYGETRPIANNNSAAGRRLNRRIQFTILK